MWNIKENTFCVETCILATSLQETVSDDSCRTPIGKICNWNLPLGVSWYRNGSTSFVIWWQWIKVSHQGKSDHQTTTIEQVAASVQQSPDRSIWHRAYRASVEWLRRIMKEKNIYSCEDKIYAIFLHDPSKVVLLDACARCQIMDLFGLCWTEATTCSMVTCCLVSGSRLPLVTYFHPLSPNYETCWPISVPTYSQGQVSVAYFSNWSSTGIAAYSSCSDVAKMHVSTQNVFSSIFHIVLHQVHWHLFCHILYYLCAKNHKFGTCRLSARDDNLGVLLSGPPCTYIWRFLLGSTLRKSWVRPCLSVLLYLHCICKIPQKEQRVWAICFVSSRVMDHRSSLQCYIYCYIHMLLMAAPKWLVVFSYLPFVMSPFPNDETSIFAVQIDSLNWVLTAGSVRMSGSCFAASLCAGWLHGLWGLGPIISALSWAPPVMWCTRDWWSGVRPWGSGWPGHRRVGPIGNRFRRPPGPYSG